MEARRDIGSLTLAEVIRVYQGSDGTATRSFYDRLERLGPLGVVAVNLMRAQKASERAKVYRGGERGRGSYRAMAYARKGWALNELSGALAALTEGAMVWGWGEDASQSWPRRVLYVDLPTGHVSFHAAERGDGPDYAAAWDGVPGRSADRILRWIGRLLAEAPASLLSPTVPSSGAIR